MLFSLVRLYKTQNQWNILSKMRSCMTCSSLKPMPLPSQREIHFWYITPDEINNGCLLNQYQDLLSPLEKDGVLCMDGNKLQKGALLAHILVRTTISRCGHVIMLWSLLHDCLSRRIWSCDRMKNMVK